MTDQSIIDRVTKALGLLGLPPGDCILVYGSRLALTSDGYSDIDILVVSSSVMSHRFVTLEIGGILLDLEILSPLTAWNSLKKDRWRNNHRLFAFSTGRPLFDDSGILAFLQRHAKDLWREGTGPHNAAIRLSLENSISKLLGIARKVSSRLAATPVPRAQSLLLTAYLDSTHALLAEAYTRANERWWYPAWVIPKLEPDDFYSELLSLYMIYFEAVDVSDKYRCIESMAARCFERLKEGDHS